jgi:sigma-B regulation protein RsbU (phosphoserine phosphatase)
MPITTTSEAISTVIPLSAPTVLVVDDEPVARLGLTVRLKRLGYRVLEASDGRSGLELLKRERPALTILDWMMPELDGPSFCEVVRRDPLLRSSQILMMTAQDQPEQIAEGLARGADDFLSKAASPQEITARVQSGLRAAALIRTLEQTTEEIRRKQDRIEEELRSAAQYVASLLPAPGPILRGVHLAYAYRPASTLGGDLFNVLHWDEHVIGLYLLDASGHGVSPALRSAAFATFLRRESLLRHVGSKDPGAILTAANTQFPLTEEGHYFTIVFARLDVRARTLAYATAGHHGALLHHRSGQVTCLTHPGLPLGFCVPQAYETIELPIAPGDRLYLFSDGLYEVPSPGGELWGQTRLVDAVQTLGRRPAEETITGIVELAAQWQGHDRFPDDAALLCLELVE